jgi:hypothetical protein
VTREDTAKLLAMLVSAYPHVKVTREMAEMYHDIVGDLEARDCYAVVRELVRTEEFFPSAAKVRRTTMRRLGRLAPAVEEAFAEVMAAASGRGLMDMPDWGHPVVADAVKAMGWRAICMSENQGVLRAQFNQVYANIARNHDTQVLTGGNSELAAPEVRSLPEGP